MNDQILALLYTPFHTHPLSLPHHLFIYENSVAKGSGISARNIFGRTVNWFFENDRFDTGDDGNRDAFRTATVHERIIFFIIEEHLGYQIFTAETSLLVGPEYCNLENISWNFSAGCGKHLEYSRLERRRDGNIR